MLRPAPLNKAVQSWHFLFLKARDFKNPWWLRMSVSGSRGKPSPSFILGDGALLQLPGYGAQHLAGIVGKIQVPNLSRGNWNYGKRFLILFHGGGANLKSKMVFMQLSLGLREQHINQTLNLRDTRLELSCS